MEEDGCPPSETLDPIAKKKHAAMLDRLSNLHQSRLQNAAARRLADSGSTSPPPFESVQSFLSLFSHSKQSIESHLDRCRSLSSDPKCKPDLKSDIEKISVSISDLERIVAENSYFLPSYEVRSSLRTVAELKEALERVNSELVPRKKFSFKNKTSKKDPNDLFREIEEAKVGEAEKSNFGFVRSSPGFRNNKSVVLVKNFRALEEDEGDFTLADLDSCEVYLKGRIRALFINRISNCRIFCGPVLGSILIEEVTSSLLMLASHQIRIHQARETDFYLRVRSRPIIEDCSGVRFGPYRLVYEGIEEELKDSSLGEETGNWENVDDFKWLRAVQSPNWCVIPEEERVGAVNASDLEERFDDN